MARSRRKGKGVGRGGRGGTESENAEGGVTLLEGGGAEEGSLLLLNAFDSAESHRGPYQQA